MTVVEFLSRKRRLYSIGDGFVLHKLRGNQGDWDTVETMGKNPSTVSCFMKRRFIAMVDRIMLCVNDNGEKIGFSIDGVTYYARDPLTKKTVQLTSEELEENSVYYSMGTWGWYVMIPLEMELHGAIWDLIIPVSAEQKPTVQNVKDRLSAMFELEHQLYIRIKLRANNSVVSFERLT